MENKICKACGEASDELNLNEVCPECEEAIKAQEEQISANTESTQSDNPISSQALDNDSPTSFKKQVQRRNEQAQEAKELLELEEQDEEEEPKSKFLKYLALSGGLGFLLFAGIKAYKNAKHAQTTQITLNEGLRNGK